MRETWKWLEKLKDGPATVRNSVVRRWIGRFTKAFGVLYVGAVFGVVFSTFDNCAVMTKSGVRRPSRLAPSENELPAPVIGTVNLGAADDSANPPGEKTGLGTAPGEPAIYPSEEFRNRLAYEGDRRPARDVPPER